MFKKNLNHNRKYIRKAELCEDPLWKMSRSQDKFTEKMLIRASEADLAQQEQPFFLTQTKDSQFLIRPHRTRIVYDLPNEQNPRL